MSSIDNLKPWKPGQSGNPGGRPKGIAARAREHTDKAIEVLVDGMADEDPRVRVVAAKEILDRGYGKPVAMTADVTRRLEDMDDDSLDAAIDALYAARDAIEGASGREEPKTAH